jgi:hypothetical protein
MSTGDWEERDATIILNPSTRFLKTAKGKALPVDGKCAIIIDSAERMLCMKKVEGVERLHWLVPIQPTTVEDVESKKIAAHNQVFAANMLRQLEETADAPTVEDYASKVQALQAQLEEAHLLHSQLYGASQEDVKSLIASAYETIASIPSTSNCERTGYNSVDTPMLHHLLAHASTSLRCSRCMEVKCDADPCKSACHVCLASTGHESTCDMVNIASTRLSVLDDASLASAMAVDSSPIDQHSTESFFPDLPSSDLARACATLHVVQQGTLEVLEQQPQSCIDDAVYSVVMSLAAQDEPSIVSGVGPVPPSPPHSIEFFLMGPQKGDISGMIHASQDVAQPESSKADHNILPSSDKARAASGEERPHHGGAPMSAFKLQYGATLVCDCHIGASHEAYNRALRNVLATFGFRYVMDNMHTLPNVVDFPPCEWVNMLTTDERAYMAKHFIDLRNAAHSIEGIDSSRPSSSVSAVEAASIAEYVRARQAVTCMVEKIHAHVLRILTQSHPFDPGGATSCGHEFLQCHSTHASLPSVSKRRIKRRRVVDVCSGKQSLAKYLLFVDPTAIVLSIDVLSPEEALSELPSHLLHRIKYVQLDAAKLTLPELRRIVKKELDCELADLYMCHFSPCCKSYSIADQGKSGYRLEDGRPNPKPLMSDGTINYARYEYACEWDKIVQTVLTTFEELARQHARRDHAHSRLAVSLKFFIRHASGEASLTCAVSSDALKL